MPVSLREEREWIPLGFERGIGSRRGQWDGAQVLFGPLDSFIPGQTTLPLLCSESDGGSNPTGISNSETDHAAIISAYINGTQKVVFAKGTKVWSVAEGSTTFGAAKATVAGAEGRQLLYAPSTNKGPLLIWITGPGAPSYYSHDAVNWSVIVWEWATAGGQGSESGTSELACLWGLELAGNVYGVLAADQYAHQFYAPTASAAGTWNEEPVTGWPRFEPLSPTGFIVMGHLGDTSETYVVIGAEIWKMEVASPYRTRYWHGLEDVVATTPYHDEFCICSAEMPALWEPTRPLRPLPIWPHGCPPGMEGRIRDVLGVDDYLLLLWQLDAGGTVVFWGRWLGEEFVWYPRTTTMTGNPPSGHQLFLMAEPTSGYSPVAGYHHGWAGSINLETGKTASNAAYAKVGSGASTEARAQGFKVEANCTVKHIGVPLGTVGSPSDDGLIAEIHADDSGKPSGAPGTYISDGQSDTLVWASICDAWQNEATDRYMVGFAYFTFSTPPSLTAGTQYHLVICRQGGNDPSNYGLLLWDDDLVIYPDGTASTYNGSVWANESPARDVVFYIYSPAEPAPAGYRQLLIPTADGSNGRLYVQRHPLPGWDPVYDTNSEYENGWLYSYTPWLDLITAGELVAEMRRVAALAEVSSTEQITLHYRAGPSSTAEGSADWGEGVLFNHLGLEDSFTERPRPSFVQFRLGMDRGSAGDTPILYNLFLAALERPDASHKPLR